VRICVCVCVCVYMRACTQVSTSPCFYIKKMYYMSPKQNYTVFCKLFYNKKVYACFSSPEHGDP